MTSLIGPCWGPYSTNKVPDLLFFPNLKKGTLDPQIRNTLFFVSHYLESHLSGQDVLVRAICRRHVCLLSGTTWYGVLKEAIK